jgi:diketogulonate reductase-like aldo/keto reductase
MGGFAGGAGALATVVLLSVLGTAVVAVVGSSLPADGAASSRSLDGRSSRGTRVEGGAHAHTRTALPPAPAGVPRVTLANGVEMPRVLLGMGPWCNGHDCYNDTAATADVRLAFSVGFNGVDGGYSNEVGVGEAVRGFDRTTVWVTSKIPPCHNSLTVEACALQTETDFGKQLAELNLSYVDLMLLHGPPNNGSGTACVGPELCGLARAQWTALTAKYTAGAVRAIGVSNYCGTCLDCLAGLSPSPHVNQVQFHAGMPGADPAGIASACKKHSTELQAYSPLGNYLNHSLIHANLTVAIGLAHNKSSAQIGLRWVLQNNHSLAVAASNPDYLKEDLDVFDWELTPSEMQQLDTVAFAPEDPTRGVCK